MTLLPVLAVVVVTAIVANVAQGGLHIATKKLKPTFKQFNLVKGLKKTFGTQALWQGVKALLKTVVIGVVLYTAIQGLVPVLMSAGGLSLSTIIGIGSGGVKKLVVWAVAAGLLLAAADLFVVMKRNRKQTRMTKKEISDENKQAEGDPHIKGQRRARQMAMSRNRMIANVADADVVVVNPTHVAVALKYTPGRARPRSSRPARARSPPASVRRRPSTVSRWSMTSRWPGLFMQCAKWTMRSPRSCSPRSRRCSRSSWRSSVAAPRQASTRWPRRRPCRPRRRPRSVHDGGARPGQRLARVRSHRAARTVRAGRTRR